MTTIDFPQVLLNLLTVYSKEELVKELKLTELDITIETLTDTFITMQKMLDLHLEQLPELHNENILLINYTH